MKNRKVLKWTNKYSGETGYVGTVSKWCFRRQL